MPRQFVMVVHMVPWRRPSSSPRCRLACRSLRNPSCHRGRNINDGIAESFHTADQCRCKCFVCNEHAVNAIRHLRVLELNNLAHGNLRKRSKPPTSKPRGADVVGSFDNVASTWEQIGAQRLLSPPVCVWEARNLLSPRPRWFANGSACNSQTATGRDFLKFR
jgi:hypothetical protein